MELGLRPRAFWKMLPSEFALYSEAMGRVERRKRRFQAALHRMKLKADENSGDLGAMTQAQRDATADQVIAEMERQRKSGEQTTSTTSAV